MHPRGTEISAPLSAEPEQQKPRAEDVLRCFAGARKITRRGNLLTKRRFFLFFFSFLRFLRQLYRLLEWSLERVSDYVYLALEISISP